MRNSSPAGREGWAWTWMGLKPPNLCYNDKDLPEKYEPFRHCFDAYYGIGDFDYWKKSEVDRLTLEGRETLLKLLLEDLKSNKPEKFDRYDGLTSAGTLKPGVDPYADRDEFFKKLSRVECSTQKTPHNARTRYAHGFHCRDCDTFFPSDSDEYIRGEIATDFWRLLHNLKVYFYRKNIDVPADVNELYEEYVLNLEHKQYIVLISYILAFKDAVHALYVKYDHVVEK